MIRYCTCILGYFAVSLFSLPSLANASGIEKLKAFVRNTQSLRAEFTQTVLNKNRPNQQSNGSVAIQRPGKFHWVYEQPYYQLLVGDGSKVWIYDKELAQATVKKLDQALGSTPAALLAGNNDIEKNFLLKDLQKAGDLEWLEATPKSKEMSFRTIQMGFDQKGNLIQMELQDNFDQTTLIRFSQLERNPKLSASLFTFTPPKGVDVISDQ